MDNLQRDKGRVDEGSVSHTNGNLSFSQLGALDCADALSRPTPPSRAHIHRFVLFKQAPHTHKHRHTHTH